MELYLSSHIHRVDQTVKFKATLKTRSFKQCDKAWNSAELLKWRVPVSLDFPVTIMLCIDVTTVSFTFMSCVKCFDSLRFSNVRYLLLHLFYIYKNREFALIWACFQIWWWWWWWQTLKEMTGDEDARFLFCGTTADLSRHTRAANTHTRIFIYRWGFFFFWNVFYILHDLLVLFFLLFSQPRVLIP